MIENRVIPCLQIRDQNLVKTVKFGKPSYIGDPMNTCRIFNELEVDEMVILGIRESLLKKKPDFAFLKKMASECFMPLSYGGGINCIEDAENIFTMGFEKIIINSAAFKVPYLIEEIADKYGSQSVIASVDVKKTIFRGYKVFSNSGTHEENVKLDEWVLDLQDKGAGELLLTNVNREGTWSGFDIDLIKRISDLLEIPLIVHGGAGSKKDVEDAVNIGGASAVALGSMVVYQNKGMGVLINYNHNYNFD